MTPPPDITSPGLLATAPATGLVAADCQTASAAAQLRQRTENHVHRPPDFAPPCPLAAPSGAGLVAADQQAASPAAQLRTRRRTVDTNPGASVGRPPARATSTGIRRTT